MAKLYGLYRFELLSNNRNNRHSPSHALYQNLKEFFDVWVLSIYDMDIQEHQYTNELVPWVKNEARFMYAEYNEEAVPQKWLDMMKRILEARFFFEPFDTVEETRQWLRDKTSLIEEPVWTFEIHPEYQDEIDWVTIPAKFITID